MNNSDSLLKQLAVPVVAGVGLLYLSAQIPQDVQAQGDTMTTSLWFAVIFMVLAGVYSFIIAWQRYRQYQARQAELEEQIQQTPAPKAERMPFVPTGDMEDGADAFVRVITGNRQLLRQFNKGTYPSYFESFCCQLEEPVAYLGDGEEAEFMAEMVLDRLEAVWKKEKEKAPFFGDQLLISAYLMPALVQQEELAFAETFRECWKRRYPHSVFQIGTYEQICQGFEKKRGCFITTAVCQSLGKDDGCYELTQFRSFRDNWLASQPEGEALIAQYYAIAPGIVNFINLQSDAPAVYRQIWENHLNPCLMAMEAGDHPACLGLYRQMVEQLSARYGA